MNLKSYCRGIGAGMIVTAIIMGIASNKRILTDDEVIKRAKELGYTESSVLISAASASDITDPDNKQGVVSISDSKKPTAIVSESKEEPIIASVEEPVSADTSIKEIPEEKIEASVEEPASISEEDPSAVEEPLDEPKEDPKDVPQEPESPASVEEPDKPSEVIIVPLGEAVTLTIERGDSSVKVARKLYELGIVESAVEFDQFLCSGGYDRYICTGQYVIAAGTDFETIAKMITKRL